MKPEQITNKALSLIANRINDLSDKARGRERLVYEDLAKRCGTTKATISRLAKWDGSPEGVNISFTDMMKYIQGLGVPVSEVFTGMEVPSISGERVSSEEAEEHLRKKGLTVLGVYAVAGAGPAWEEEHAEPIFNIAIPRQYLNPLMTTLFINGTSMEPTILDNSVVGVNRGKKTVVQGRIYAVRLPYEGIVVKRLYIDHEGERFILKSDNKKDKEEFPDIFVPFSDGDHFIYGQVSWVLQSYDR